MENENFLEEILRSRQFAYIRTKENFNYVENKYKNEKKPEYAYEYFNLKMELRKEIDALLVAKYFIYKENRHNELNHKQMLPINFIHNILNEKSNSVLCDLMNLELRYYGHKKECFIKELLTKNIFLFENFLINQGAVFGFNIQKELKIFINSEEHKQKIQTIINLLKKNNVSKKEDVIEFICQTIAIDQKGLETNKKTELARTMREILPYSLDKKTFKNKSESLETFKNYAAIHTYFVNIL